MASIAVVLGFAQGFADMGIGNAIIARQTTSRETLSTLYWVNLLAGLGTCAAVLACTPLIISFYHQPALVHLLPWAALTFALAPLGRQFQILLEKELNFAHVARIEITAVVVAFVVAVASAASGAGALALVWGVMANVATRSLLLSIFGWTHWRPTLRLRRRDLDGYIGFGLFQMGEQSVNYLAANVDYLIVGHFLGAEALGEYALAYQLIAKPLLTINPALTRVAFPVFATRSHDNAAMRRGFLELTHLLALIAFPLMIGLALSAPAFVPVVFGSGWSTTASLVPILAIVGLVKMIANPMGSVLLAKGRADLGFALNVILFVVMAGTLLSVVQFGVVAVASAYAAVSVVMFMLSRVLLYRLIALSLGPYLRVLAGPAAMSGVMGLAMGAVYVGVHQLTGSAAIMLVVEAVVGVLTYVPLVARCERAYLHELWSLVRTRPTSAQAGPEPSVALS